MLHKMRPFVFMPKNPHHRLLEILHWYVCGADEWSGRRCKVKWLPNFLGWVVYHIFLPMVLRYAQFACKSSTKIILTVILLSVIPLLNTLVLALRVATSSSPFFSNFDRYWLKDWNWNVPQTESTFKYSTSENIVGLHWKHIKSAVLAKEHGASYMHHTARHEKDKSRLQCMCQE